MYTSKPNWSEQSRKQQLLFFQIGLAITMAFVIMAFEWTIQKPVAYDPARPVGEDEPWIIDQTPPTKVPAPPVQPVEKPKPTPTQQVIVNTTPPDNPPPDEPMEGNPQNNIPPFIWEPAPREIEEPDNVWDFPQVYPSFPGGDAAFSRFLQNTFLKNSQDCDEEEKVSGIVGVEFIIDKDGTPRDPVIIKGLTPCLEQAAIRTVLAMPKWNPGIQGDKPVKVRYKLPFKYQVMN